MDILAIILWLILCLMFVGIVGYEVLTSMNPYFIVNSWNEWLTELRDEQNTLDSIDYRNAPGLQYAHKSRNETIRRLNADISLRHKDILCEVNELMSEGYEGMPMWKVDSTQRVFKGKGDGWKPIWIRFFSHWSDVSQRLPVLREIVSRYDDVILLHVSVFGPKTELKEHYGICKGHYRYHYGLKVPKGDIGLLVERGLYRWIEGEGICFDDTHKHSSWNRTDEVRMVLFADVVRDMPVHYKWINNLVYRLLERTKHMRGVREKIDRRGIVLD